MTPDHFMIIRYFKHKGIITIGDQSISVWLSKSPALHLCMEIPSMKPRRIIGAKRLTVVNIICPIFI